MYARFGFAQRMPRVAGHLKGRMNMHEKTQKAILIAVCTMVAVNITASAQVVENSWSAWHPIAMALWSSATSQTEAHLNPCHNDRQQVALQRPSGVPLREPNQAPMVLVARRGVWAQDESPHSGKRAHFPGKHWQSRSAEAVGLDTGKLDDFARAMGGDGCIVRDGYLIKTWGRFNQNADWASAAKPVLSTLLLLAVQEGRLASVDARVKDVGWPLKRKDASMTFRHLANMVSGYACGEAPGEAWGYNDFAIQLYAKSLVKVYRQPLEQVFTQRLAVLQCEDGHFFGSRNGNGVTASPRDFARLGYLWLNCGRWRNKQVLSVPLMRQFLRSGVPAGLPRTAAPGDDYLGIGSYGGGTNQTPHGPGGYGFNLWFNSRLASGEFTWPGLPTDAYQANGMWNRDSVTIIPSLRMVVAVRGAKATSFAPGDASNQFNRLMAMLAQAATGPPPDQE